MEVYRDIEIRKAFFPTKQDFGIQYVVLHFASIEGRDDPCKCEWQAQSETKMDAYEQFLHEQIKQKLPTYPVIFGAIPPHAGTLFGFGLPVIGQNDNNIHRIAKLNVHEVGTEYQFGLEEVQQMPFFAIYTGAPMIQPQSLVGCPLDLKVMNYELDRWLATGKDPQKWFNQWRDPSDILAKVISDGDPTRSGI